MGIGSELRGDDGAGSRVAQTLQVLLGNQENLLFLDAGSSPESFTSPLRRFRPDLLVMVDVARFNGCPGEVRWIDLHEIDGISSMTHSLPLYLIGDYLAQELGCEVRLLGIQPESLEFGQGLSAPIENAVAEISQFMRALIEEKRRETLRFSLPHS